MSEHTKSGVCAFWQHGELLLNGEPARLVVANALKRGWIWPKSPEELRAAAKASDEAEAKAEKEAA